MEVHTFRASISCDVETGWRDESPSLNLFLEKKLGAPHKADEDQCGENMVQFTLCMYEGTIWITTAKQV